MMTAEIRKIRPYGRVTADEPSDTHDFDASGIDTGSAPPAGAEAPFNDNARDTATGASPEDEEFDDDAFVQASDDAVDDAVRARRRGPLVTRWIGFAAQRRRAQARANRMRDRQG